MSFLLISEFLILNSHFYIKMQNLRIAAVTLASRLGQNHTNRERMRDFVIQAAAMGVQMICFPETAITGYGPADAMKEAAEMIPGPSSLFFADLADAHNLVILAGLAERSVAGKYYISHLVCIPQREVGVYRKIHLGPPERDHFTAGNQAPLFDGAGVRFGVQLCYDAHFPELSGKMACDGAELIVIPHASPRGQALAKLASWMRHLPARAFDNSVFVIACNLSGAANQRLTFPGLAVALSPGGHVLAQHTEGGEAIMVVDLQADELTAVRNHPMRFFLPHRRPEIYSL